MILLNMYERKESVSVLLILKYKRWYRLLNGNKLNVFLFTSKEWMEFMDERVDKKYTQINKEMNQ